MPLRSPALNWIDGVKPPSASSAVCLGRRILKFALSANGTRRNLSRPVPRRTVRHPREQQLAAPPEIACYARVEIQAPEILRVSKGTVLPRDLDRDNRAPFVA